MMPIRTLFAALIVLSACTFLAAEDEHSSVAPESPVPENLRHGLKLYVKHCASCHGTSGQGVTDKYDEALYGDKSLIELTEIIQDTMPIEDPEIVVDEDAKAVAEYLYGTFYTAEGRAKNQPPRVDLVRLTNDQFSNSITDLMSNFLGRGTTDQTHGLSAEYFDSRRMQRDKRKIERVDPVVSFDFKEESPGEGIEKEEFSMRWVGAITAPETGEYEFCVKTENGFRLWVNNNSIALIDGWVASGGEVSEHRQKIHLLGGRSYPIRLEYFKFKDKTASVELRWTPPGGFDDVISSRFLTKKSVPESFVISTPFPPDDASLGYERGSSISAAWRSATTQAAIEVANGVVSRIDRLSGAKREDEKRAEKIKNFAYRFVEYAFRRPLTDEQKELFVESQFAKVEDLEEAVKRVVILALQSPHFLYPELSTKQVDSYNVASRLSFNLWDSLPDQALLQAASRGELLNENSVRQHAARMLKDDRARYKMRGFFHDLLPYHEATDLTKDSEAFPEFDAKLLSDLKTSLDLFIDDVVWSEASDYRELLLSNEMFMNPRLAKFYDAEIQSGEEFEKVSFDPQQRSGVVTHPFLLSALSYHQTTSPIHRGVFMTRKILNRSLKPPPIATEFKDSTFDPSLTMREKVAELTKSKACMTCHSTINPLGFSLENYDAVGRYRTIDNKKPINAKSDLVVSSDRTITLTGPRDVAEYAVSDEQAQRGFIEHLFHHQVKQAARAYGDETLEELRVGFVKSDYNIQKLLIEMNVQTVLHGASETKGKK